MKKVCDCQKEFCLENYKNSKRAISISNQINGSRFLVLGSKQCYWVSINKLGNMTRKP